MPDKKPHNSKPQPEPPLPPAEKGNRNQEMAKDGMPSNLPRNK